MFVRLIHSKTVTWADDPDNNYKKDDPTQFYETQNITNDIPSETYYAGDTGESQQFRNEYTPQTNTPLDIEPSDAHYQYDTNQYQAQTDATPTNENVYSNEEYYYPDEQVNQYEQYDSQQQQQVKFVQSIRNSVMEVKYKYPIGKFVISMTFRKSIQFEIGRVNIVTHYNNSLKYQDFKLGEIIFLNFDVRVYQSHESHTLLNLILSQLKSICFIYYIRMKRNFTRERNIFH